MRVQALHQGLAAALLTGCHCSPCSVHHFQSADALAVTELPPSSGGGLLAAAFDREGVAVWQLPAAGAVASLGVASQVTCCPADAAARRAHACCREPPTSPPAAPPAASLLPL